MNVRTALVATLAMVCACRGAVDPNRDLRVTIAADREAFIAGQINLLTVTLTNHSAASVTVPTPWCGAQFEVMRDGVRVGPPGRVCLHIVTGPTTVAPGDSISATYPWTGDGGGPTESGSPLEPGTYALIGLMQGTDGRRLESDPINVRIIAAP